MNRQRMLSGTVLALALIALPAFAADDQLEEIKRLYFAARYEEALTALNRAFPNGSLETDEYVVLCYLGLGRTDEAEQVIERLVLENPLVPLDVKGRSPKFAAAYQPVRRRLVGIVAETMYGLARTSFKSGNRSMASAQFKELSMLLETADLKSQRASDLKMLADGFARLTEPRTAVVGPALPEKAQDVAVDETLVMNIDVDSPVPPPAESRPFSPWRPQTFSANDVDVKAPVVIAQAMPPWNAPRGYSFATLRGSVEVVIGEDGLVITAKTIARTHPSYDQLLVAAARKWAYQPATKDGRAVKYRKVVEFSLTGR